MSQRDVPIRDGRRPGPLPVEEVARLDALGCVSLAAAHALNNALTAIAGEASFLRDERKEEAEVVEACQTILGEVERCGRLTRAVLSRRARKRSEPESLDATRLVREVAALLGETLGPGVELRSSTPTAPVLVRGERDALELMLVSLIHYATQEAGGSPRIRIELQAPGEDSEVRLELAVSGSDLPPDVAEAVLDPSRAASDVARTRLEAVALTVAAHGGRRYARRTGPDSWSARVHLPRADDTR